MSKADDLPAFALKCKKAVGIDKKNTTMGCRFRENTIQN